MYLCTMDKGGKNTKWVNGKESFQYIVAEKLDSHRQKMKPGAYPTPLT